MDTLFRKHRSRTSGSTTPAAPSPSLEVAGVPYSQLPAAQPIPTVGPSNPIYYASARRDGITVNDVGAPSTNPSLGATGTPSNAYTRPQPSPRPERYSNRTSTADRERISNDDGHKTGHSAAIILDDEASEILNQGLERSSSRNQQHQLAEFGGSRHPYAAAARDPDSVSIRTVSSVNSTKRDLGRYPSFGPSDSRVSISSRSTHTLVTPRSAGPTTYPSYVAPSTSNLAGSRLSEEFHLSRPNDEEVNKLFQQLIETRNVDDHSTSTPSLTRTSVSSQATVAQGTANLPADIKWQMIEADARARYDAEQHKRRKEDEMLRSGKASKRGTASAVVKNSPEWFLKKILDGSITSQHISTLTVSLRTQPYE